jgi:SAM-dependent methyltransferase
MENELNEKYWEAKYQSKKLGWDIGYVSTPIKDYVDQLTDRDLGVLIPGAGNSYEAEYLHKNSFKNVDVLDFANIPLEALKQRVPTFNTDHLHHTDFFSFEGQFDLIIEQTFLSALAPARRQEYVRKMNSLLKPGGRLVGVLFNIDFKNDHPPFGGDLHEYKELFAPYFNIKIMETALNSIPERNGSEIFINLEKQSNI